MGCHSSKDLGSSAPGPSARDPPPYGFVAELPSPSTNIPVQPSRRAGGSSSEPDYEKLREYDTVLLIDDSGSMSGSNWKETASALASLVPIITKYDSDGVDVYFLNNDTRAQNITNGNSIFKIFSDVKPSGATPTGRKLGQILRSYLREYGVRRKSTKPMNIIVITDGSPSDPDRLEREIIHAAKELDRMNAPDRQLGIQFFQVGGDEAAADSLEELDNALAEENGVRDIVDTVSYRSVRSSGSTLTADGMLKVVLGAVDDSLDNKRIRAPRRK